MSAAIETCPLKRLHVLALLDHDAIVMRSALTGGEQVDHDHKLAGIIVAAGLLAASLTAQTKCFHEHLQRIYGFTAGWVMALGVRDVQNRIAAERERQEKLFLAGKFNYTCASATASVHAKLRILVEEIGDVAEAIDQIEWVESKGNFGAAAIRREELAAELVQVAAVAVAWLESLETN